MSFWGRPLARSVLRAGNSSAVQSIRLMLARPRIWYPTLCDYAPQFEANSRGASFWFCGDIVQGGGTLWMPFVPYGAEAKLTPSEIASVAMLVRNLKHSVRHEVPDGER